MLEGNRSYLWGLFLNVSRIAKLQFLRVVLCLIFLSCLLTGLVLVKNDLFGDKSSTANPIIGWISIGLLLLVLIGLFWISILIRDNGDCLLTENLRRIRTKQQLEEDLLATENRKTIQNIAEGKVLEQAALEKIRRGNTDLAASETKTSSKTRTKTETETVTVDV